MPFFTQSAISYVAAIAVGTIILTRGGDGFFTIAGIYGVTGLPFGLLAAGLCRLFEKFIGLPGPALALTLLAGALYWIAPNKQNAALGFVLVIPYVVAFTAVWTFLSWRYRSA